MLLLRCALESANDAIAQSCISGVEAMTNRLRRAKEDDDWDLGDDCLARCERILHRMTTGRRRPLERRNEDSVNANSEVSGFTPFMPAGFALNPEDFSFDPRYDSGDLWQMLHFDENDFGNP
jgi:hypothetical protein